MKLSEIKELLPTLETVEFQLEDGTKVPAHFHITEVGMVTKKYIDCGGTIRNEKNVSFQLWNADDFDHRLKPGKLLNIIKLSERKIEVEDAEIEVEYQGSTINKFGLRFENPHFILVNKMTDCLAKDKCGIPVKEETVVNTCAPNSGCC